MFLSPLVKYISFVFCFHIFPKCYIIFYEHFYELFFYILILDAFFNFWIFNCRNFLNCELTVSYMFVCLTLIVQYYRL